MEKQKTSAVEPVLLTIPQVARTLGLSRAMIYLLIRRGELRCIHVGRAVRVTRAEVRRFVLDREAAEQPKHTSSSDRQQSTRKK